MAVVELTRRVVDQLLEASVVGSFSRIGPAVRRRVEGWTEPPDVSGRRIVVTGATSGLGLAMADELARLGADLCLIGRDEAKLAAAVDRIARAGPGPVTSERADMEDLAEVEHLALRLAERFSPLDVLINNAGVMVARRRPHPGGLEATVVVDLLAPFLLTEQLLPALQACGAARVVTVTSGGMYTQRFDLDHLVVPEGAYRGAVAYARAKRAEVVLTGEWQRRYGSSGVSFHAVHPGWADTPGLSASLPRFAAWAGPILRTPAEGADTAVWLAGSPQGQPAGGRLWLDRRPRSAYRLPQTWVPPAERVAEGRALWDWCARQVHLDGRDSEADRISRR